MILMGRPSLSVISVMLLPAAAMERRRLSSSSVQKRGLLFGMVMSLRPQEKKAARCLALVDAQGQFEGASWNALAFNEDGFRQPSLQDAFGNVMILGIFARRRGSNLRKQAGPGPLLNDFAEAETSTSGCPWNPESPGEFSCGGDASWLSCRPVAV